MEWHDFTAFMVLYMQLQKRKEEKRNNDEKRPRAKKKEEKNYIENYSV